jgi:hypothetical protein
MRRVQAARGAKNIAALGALVENQMPPPVAKNLMEFELPRGSFLWIAPLKVVSKDLYASCVVRREVGSCPVWVDTVPELGTVACEILKKENSGCVRFNGARCV